MRLQILSDIHTEFHRDFGQEIIKNYLMPKNVDVLIIAGDLTTPAHFDQTLGVFSEHFRKSLILFVPGNHDFYGTSIKNSLINMSLICSKYKNVRLLYNRAVEIDGIPFVGTTLWFREDPKCDTYSTMLSDYSLISDLRTRVFKENKKALDFLQWHVNTKSVVITHHVPTAKSMVTRYENDPLNIFFICDMEKLIERRKPRLWVHGHTHNTFNYMLHETHIVCNPLGYLGRGVNEEFIPNFLIEM